MRSGGCWSSVVASPQERVALALTPDHDWLVACVLPAGHDGAHGSDGAQKHEGRRRWLLWGDYARGAQNLADEVECSAEALDGAPCVFFGGHGGPHRYAEPVGQDFPAHGFPAQAAPSSRPVGDRGRHERTAPLPSDEQQAAAPQPSTPAVPPPWMPAARRAPGAETPQAGRVAPREPQPLIPPLPPEDESISVSSLDALFAGMPSLKDLPHTELLAFPEGSFRSAAPSWPDSRGAYVAQHHAAGPVEPELLVSGPDRFEPAQAADEEIIDVEEVPDPGRGRRRRDRREPATSSGRHGVASGPAEPVEAADSHESPWLQVRPGAASVLTTPMVEVISSNGDPVRMGVPTARRRLADGGDLAAVTAAVEDAADRLQGLPEADGDGEVSAALHDVGQALARLSEILRSR
ncbi:hypothetical protein [Gordonia hydrophobica]|uniref:Uncharacterized protein n=1 Tax=Gordonia hydrophobica TaxID=40516 RepID=A0ABZ2U8C1_9ACTN|nr:hypothetical protein [Gordonia hydrophobica]MBM7365672.1 hypothetical protein [Gordonia hydrophobica]